MKKFIMNVFSSMLGFCLAIGVFILFGLIVMISAIASSDSKPNVTKGSVLHIELKGSMVEQGKDNPFSQFIGDKIENLAVNEALEAIAKAKNIEEIKGIFLDGGALAGDPASMQEIRKALLDFKKSGKFIMAYSEIYSQGAYYLSSVADKIAVNPKGVLDWHGLASQPIFFKDLMEKFGVKMQVFKVGTFKSAVEPFTCTEMSEPNRLQVTSFLQSIWNVFVKEVSESRNIKPEDLQLLADRLMPLRDQKEYVKSNLVDTLVYIDGAKQMLKQLAGLKESEKLNFLTIKDVCKLDDPTFKNSSNEVAIYYAAGDIVDAVTSGFSQASQIVGSKVVEDMQKLEDDDDVKAVVLRINSGGGSANASEQMWHAIKKLSAKKPVVVSMGGMAASGGYYMSSASNYIFAEPTTLTGSIGIFGMIPDASNLLTQKLGLKFDCVKTNAMSDFGAMGRPMNASECELMQAMVENGYSLFLSRVAEGRKMSTDAVDSIGQGRVWTGEQALKLGLVDKLGNLNDAIVYAAEKAKLKNDYKTKEFPDSEPWYLEFMNEKKQSYYESKMRNTMGELYEPYMILKNISSQSPLQARILFEPNIK